MNEANLRKLYERLGIAESPVAPPPPALPLPPALPPPPVAVRPPVAPPLRAEPLTGATIPSALDRLIETRVSLSLPMLLVALGAIGFGLVLIVRQSAAPPKAPVATAPSPPPPRVVPPAAPPQAPAEPTDPPAPPPPEPAPKPLPTPPPPNPPAAPPELSPAERRAGRIRQNGGNDATEAAVAGALDWLARHQAETGEWEAMHFERRCPRESSCQVPAAPGDPLYTPGVTGLAVLAFLRAGHGPTGGPYSRNVALGLAWLVEHQDPEGAVGMPGKRILFYNHAVATRALCEAAALTRDARFRGAGQKALDYLEKTQLVDGGWNYYRDPAERDRNDASIAGWAAFAVRAAEEAGLGVAPVLKNALRDLFVRRTDAKTGEVLYAEREPGAGRRGSGLAALGLFVRGGFGEDDPETARKAAARVLSARPDAARFAEAQSKSKQIRFSPEQNMAGWYYGAEAMFRRGGDDWSAWNGAMCNVLLGLQVIGGHAGGSWPPETSYIGREGGRVFSTAISVMMLTMYARER